MADITSKIDTIWRMEAPKIIGGLARLVRDVGLAEELAQDALVQALEQWPQSGVPQNPGAWLMLTAKRRAIDRFRRDRLIREKNREVAREAEAYEDVSVSFIEAHMDDDIGDERLALIFTACHPVLGAEQRAALTLRLVGGLTPNEIARAFLSTETTIQQRIVRAKKTLREQDVVFEVPHGHERNARLASVLEVLYLIYNEGYAATAGDDLLRPQLTNEAMRLGRILSSLMPHEPEALGLIALMELQAARFPARTDADGNAVLLNEQDRRKWDRLLIRRGLKALEEAYVLTKGPGGPYQIQAAIAACHARARTPEETDWLKIAALYAALVQKIPSPVIELNRAIAISMALGPQEALPIVEEIEKSGTLQNYHLLPSVKGDLLERMGQFNEAGLHFKTAAEMAGNEREKSLLRARAEKCRAHSGKSL